MNVEKSIKYAGGIAILLLVAGLFWWYVMLQGKTESIEAVQDARGFSVGIPSFAGSRGSTAANIAGIGRGTAFSEFVGIGRGERAEDSATTRTSGETQSAPRLFQVSTSPVAGSAILGDTLRYVERATGHVFDVILGTNDVRRITNTLTPRTYEARIGAGERVFKRFLTEAGTTYAVGTISTTTEEGYSKLNMTDLPPLRAIAVRPDRTDILAIPVDRPALVRIATTSSTLAAVPHAMHILWGENIVLVEHAGSGVWGSAFEIEKDLQPLLTNIPGLTMTLGPKGAYLYSSDDGIRVRLFLKSAADAAPIEIPLATVAEKCVMGTSVYCAVPKELPRYYLDEWYRGAFHSSDSWYRIDMTGNVEVLVDDENRGIDVEMPQLDPKEQFLVFTNARDKSLWSLRIEK